MASELPPTPDEVRRLKNIEKAARRFLMTHDFDRDPKALRESVDHLRSTFHFAHYDQEPTDGE